MLLICMISMSLRALSIRLLPVAKEWQDRPLEDKYAVVFMDATHYNVRSERRIIKIIIPLHFIEILH